MQHQHHPNHFFSFEQFFVSILPETNIAPENGWLEYVGILVSCWDGLLSGAILDSGSVRLKLQKNIGSQITWMTETPRTWPQSPWRLPHCTDQGCTGTSRTFYQSTAWVPWICHGCIEFHCGCYGWTWSLCKISVGHLFPTDFLGARRFEMVGRLKHSLIYKSPWQMTGGSSRLLCVIYMKGMMLVLWITLVYRSWIISFLINSKFQSKLASQKRFHCL